MSDRLSLQVALEGAEKVIAELRGIDKFANSMQKKAYKVKIDAAVNKLNKSVDAMRKHQSNFNNAWKNTDKYVDNYNKKLQNAQTRLDQCNKKLKQTNENIAYAQKYGAANKPMKQLLADAKKYESVGKTINAEMGKYRKIIGQLKDFGSVSNRKAQNKKFGNFVSEARSEARLAKDRMMHEFQGIEVKPDLDLGRVYNKWSGFASRMGASMITLGNTLQRITMPFDSIVRGAMYGIGYGALGKVTEGLSSSTSRYDTIKTYPQIMKSLGFEAEKTSKTIKEGTYTAEESIDDLNESVIGLPTGLDEIVDMAKRYVLATHDMKTGTDVAIAANNAFLASASTEQQRYQGMMQLNDVLSGKKLQTREWMSLAASMPAAMQEIGKLLGYEKNSEFLQALYGNKINNGKFIKALREVGTEGGKIAEMAEISKQTFEGLSSNIKNAFSRGGYKLLEALDDVLIAATGEGTVGNFKKITNGIDSIFESGAKWMKANPDVIMDFFTKLKEFDWGGLVSGFGKGVLGALEIFKKFVDFLGDRGIDASKVGTMMVKWNLIGKGLTIMGGSLKGLAPLIGGTGVLGKLIKSGAIGAFISKLITPLAKIGSAGAAVKGAETIANVGGAASKIPLSWQGVVSQASSIAAIPAVAFSFMEVAKAFKVLSTIGSWEGMGKKVLHCMEAIAVFVGEAAGIGALLTSTPAGWFAAVATGVGGVTMAGIAKVMQMSVKAVNDVANAEVPSTYKISAVIGSIKTMMTEMKDIDTTLPQGQKNVGDNAKKFEDVFSSISAIVRGMKDISEVEVNAGAIEKAKETIRTVGEAIEGIKIDIAKMFGDKTYTSEIRGSYSTKNAFNGDALEGALGNAQNVNNILTQITTLIDNLKAFSDKAKVLKGLGDMKELTNQIGTMVADMGTIATRIKQQSESLEGIGDAPARFQALVECVGSIKKVMSTVQTLNETYGMGAELTIFNSLSRMISGMKGAIQGAGDMVGDATKLSQAAGMIKTAITDIKSAIEGIDDKIDKTITVKVAAKIKGKSEAIGKVNDLSSAVDQARVTLQRAVTNLSGTYNANVTVNVNGTLHNNLPSLPVTPTFPHTGGYIDGRGRLLYKAGGGSVPFFKRRGSDTVPAMLTPGEYVNRRAAVEHFGAGFFERLNHLDLEGALRSISTRASRFAGGNTYNITNKTNNARVVQHIHTHDTNYAFKRANRFVEAL